MIKSILTAMLLTLTCLTGPALSSPNYVAPMGSLISSFEYLKSKPIKVVNKRLPVKTVNKKTYIPSIPTAAKLYDRAGSFSGKASYYWQGQRTANGEAFKPDGISCAHKTLPFNSRLKVTNLSNGKSVVCRVNDRGPFIAGRIVDLSRGAARVIDMTGAGVVPVKLEVL